MAWISNNLGIFFGLVVIAAVVFMGIVSFIELPKVEKIESCKEWLKWAVCEAERIFGSQTGQLKLRYVYNLFVITYPELAKHISFYDIQLWVDEALEWLNGQLNANKAVKDYVDNN